MNQTRWAHRICDFISHIVHSAVTTVFTAIPAIGAATTVGLTVAGQQIASLFVDRYGWFRLPRRPISARRFGGVAMLSHRRRHHQVFLKGFAHGMAASDWRGRAAPLLCEDLVMRLDRFAHIDRQHVLRTGRHGDDAVYPGAQHDIVTGL